MELEKMLTEFLETSGYSVNDRKDRGRDDFRFFAHTYFPHYFYREGCFFHDEIMADLQEMVVQGGGQRKVRAAPRGHAKSTIVSKIFPIWCIVYQKKNYIVIISKTSTVAEDFLADIKDELVNNPMIKEDFGNLVGETWRTDKIVTSTGICVTALGARKQVRGLIYRQYRPDLFLVDDLEDDELIRIEEQRSKLKNWFFKAVMKAGDKHTDFFVVGTILHYDSLLADLIEKTPGFEAKKYRAIIKWSESPKWDDWERIITDLNIKKDEREEQAYKFFLENKEEMLENTEVLWPEKHSYYDLMVMMVSEGRSSFASEMQNDPVNPEDNPFNKVFTYKDEEVADAKANWIWYGALDPAMGKSRTADFAVIITVGLDSRTGQMYVEDCWAKKCPIEQTVDQVIERGKIYPYYRFGVETNAAQIVFKRRIEEKSAEARVYIPTVENYAAGDKDARIRSLQPYIENGYIKINEKLTYLIQLLKNYPHVSKVDPLDCLQQCVSMITDKPTVYVGGVPMYDISFFGQMESVNYG